MKPKLENLFVYGTLRDAEVQRSVIGREISGRVQHLLDYRPTAVHIDEEVFQGIEPRIGSRVIGTVLLVTSDELEKIDAYETDTYRRERYILADGTKAHVYVPVRMPTP